MIFFRFSTLACAICFALGLGLASPAAAIQNIGFPDDQSLILGAADFTQFNAAQKKMLDALATVVKYDGVEGEAKQVRAALEAFAKNALVVQGLAKRAGNSDVANFMATLKSWSTSGDADIRPADLMRKIGASLQGLSVVKK